MYGLVNRALHELVVARWGLPMWEEIRKRAELDVEEFNGFQAYPDSVTYRLVGAASECLNVSPESLLESFGEHWVLFTGQEGYGDLLDLAGANLVTFLQNLDALHVRVARSYPALVPPSFKCTDITERSLLLHYFSSRDGLAPLVVGLIKGLGKRFNTDVRVELLHARGPLSDHDVFRVEFELGD